MEKTVFDLFQVFHLVLWVLVKTQGFLDVLEKKVLLKISLENTCFEVSF